MKLPQKVLTLVALSVGGAAAIGCSFHMVMPAPSEARTPESTVSAAPFPEPLGVPSAETLPETPRCPCAGSADAGDAAVPEEVDAGPPDASSWDGGDEECPACGRG